jgi:hypothetical protein
MTPEQATALAHPCLLAAETINQRFHHVKGKWSLVLTINTGSD